MFASGPFEQRRKIQIEAYRSRALSNLIEYHDQ